MAKGDMNKKGRTEASDKPLRLEWIDPATLDDNPSNWRRHPEAQLGALKDTIAEVGWAGALLYNERTKRLIDGHGRKKIATPGEPVPVLVGSWDEATERKILATLDPLAAMAETDQEVLNALLAEVQTGSDAVQSMLDAMATEDEETELRQLETKPPPKMTWVLIGIPTVRFGEIAETVEQIAAIPDTICESTVNDG